MSRSLWKTLLALAALVAVLRAQRLRRRRRREQRHRRHARAERGGRRRRTSPSSSSPAPRRDNIADPDEGKKGGKLTVLSAGDVDYMDPRQDVLHVRDRDHQRDPPRPLRVPARPSRASRCRTSPTAMPEISEDGKTVTVKIKKGVMFSKPVSREVTSTDVKYAIERAFTANVANGYARVYLGDLVGAPKEPGDYKEIPGIETPDDQTIVFKLTKGTGAALAGALAMPISVPVPKEYAQKYDKRDPVDLRRGHAVYTGPYMVESDAEGKATGYVPGKRIHLVRNPDYAPVDDFRPAFLDEIDIQAGNEDTAVATRRILSGESLAGGDIEPPGEPAQAAAREQQDRAVGGAGRWLAHDLDGHEPPAVRRHQRPQGRDRRLQPRRGAPAARRRGARPDRPALHPAGHGRASRSPTASTAGSTRWTGCRSRRATARCRPSTSRRPACRSGQVRGRRGAPDRRRQRRAGQVDRADHRAAAQRDGLQDEAPPRHARHDVHEVLQRAGLRGQRLPVRGLGAGLLGSADDARPDVQRREHHPDAATRTGRSSTCPRSTRRSTTRSS